jgi:hypothetical protein
MGHSKVDKPSTVAANIQQTKQLSPGFQKGKEKRHRYKGNRVARFF